MITTVLMSALLTMSLTLAASPPETATEARQDAARKLAASMGARSIHPMDHDARTTWAFLPGIRHGTRLSDMTPQQRDDAMALLRTLVSRNGYETVTGIFLLEGELRDRAIAAGRPNASRDPDQYTFAIWGDPATPQWAARVEGHHVSLNYTQTADGIRMTPLFLGAAPVRVLTGPRAGTAPLAHIETIALALRNSLTAEQTNLAVLSMKKPHDILLQPGRETSLLKPEGLPAGTLSGPQRGLLIRLVSAYSGLLATDIGTTAQRRLLEGGPDALTFAWIGGTSPEVPRYWRLHGPDWIIEFDCVGNSTDHVHTVWHDLRCNFGADLLQQHLSNHDH